jgi:peptide subunit release factor 1 (eRF1)
VEKVVDVLPIPMRATEQEVLERLQPAAYAYERAHEKELLTQVIDFAKSGGRGALGRKAVMDALQQQRVELLILPYPMDDQALMEQMTQLVMQSSGSIEFVHDNEAERLRQEGGVAARLYYAL